MSISVVCSHCRKELNRPGALVFSPPDNDYISKSDNFDNVKKFHICSDCWTDLAKWIELPNIIEEDEW